MAGQNMKQVMAIEWKNKKRILAVNPNVDDGSGIYFLTRQDEDGFKFAYIGQAKHLLARLAQHLSGYQHIDLSLRKHGLYSTDNPNGWKINFQHYSIDELDEKEQFFIKQYALAGYQLRNKTSGSQGEGKAKIAEYRPAKGYREGLAQGRKILARELSHIIEKHLDVQIKPEKQGNKISEKAFEKFRNLLNERGEDHEE